MDEIVKPLRLPFILLPELVMLFSNIASTTPLDAKRSVPPSTYIVGESPKMIVAAIIELRSTLLYFSRRQKYFPCHEIWCIFASMQEYKTSLINPRIPLTQVLQPVPQVYFRAVAYDLFAVSASGALFFWEFVGV